MAPVIRSGQVADDGDDLLEVVSTAESSENTADEVTAKGLVDTTVNAGADDDALLMEVTGEDRAIGMENSTLNVGDSDDVIDVIVEATNEENGEAIGLSKSTISSGGGDDAILIVLLLFAAAFVFLRG